MLWARQGPGQPRRTKEKPQKGQETPYPPHAEKGGAPTPVRPPLGALEVSPGHCCPLLPGGRLVAENKGTPAPHTHSWGGVPSRSSRLGDPDVPSADLAWALERQSRAWGTKGGSFNGGPYYRLGVSNNGGVSEGEKVQGQQIPPHPLQGDQGICKCKYLGATGAPEVGWEKTGLLKPNCEVK